MNKRINTELYARLHDAITDFVKDGQKPSIDSGWPEVTTEEKQKLRDIICALIELKWERDCDGDLPMKATICDCTKERWMYPTTIPHEHGVDKISKLALAIRHASEELEFELQNIKDVVPKYIRTDE